MTSKIFKCYSDCIEGPPTCGCPYRYIDELVEALEKIDALDRMGHNSTVAAEMGFIARIKIQRKIK